MNEALKGIGTAFVMVALMGLVWVGLDKTLGAAMDRNMAAVVAHQEARCQSFFALAQTRRDSLDILLKDRACTITNGARSSTERGERE